MDEMRTGSRVKAMLDSVFPRGPVSRVIYGFLVAAFLVMPLGTSPYTIAGAAILAAWIFSGAFIRRFDAWKNAHWLWPVLAMVFLLWAGLAYSPDGSGLGLAFAGKSYYWLYAFALAGLGLSSRGVDVLLTAFMTGLAVNAGVGFFQAAGLVPVFVDIGDHAYIGLYGGHNTLSLLLVLGMLTASFYFRTVKGHMKWVFAAFVLIYFCHIVIMESRGGYLTFLIFCPFVLHNMLGGRSWRLVGLVFIMVVGLMFSSPIVRQRAVGTVEEVSARLRAFDSEKRGSEYSRDLDRLYMWWWAVHLFMEHPLRGVGTGGYKEATIRAGGEMGIAHPHNNLLYMAASFGIPGVMVFCWLFWVLIKEGWRHRREPLGFFTLSSSMAILVGGMTETHLLDAGGAFLMATTAGLQSSRASWSPEVWTNEGVP